MCLILVYVWFFHDWRNWYFKMHRKASGIEIVVCGRCKITLRNFSMTHVDANSMLFISVQCSPSRFRVLSHVCSSVTSVRLEAVKQGKNLQQQACARYQAPKSLAHTYVHSSNRHVNDWCADHTLKIQKPHLIIYSLGKFRFFWWLHAQTVLFWCWCH